MRFRRTGWMPVGVASMLALASCVGVKGSGHLTTRQVPVGAFSRLEVTGSFDVTVAMGPTAAVSVRTDDNLSNRVDIHVSGSILHIGLTSGSPVRDATLHADVTASTFTGIDASGAAQIHLSGELQTSNLDLEGSGASSLDGGLHVDRGSLHLSGASHARVTGIITALDAHLDGASDLDARNLQAADLTVELSGASGATVSVSDTISAELSGASTLRYGGNPHFVRRDVSGASSIERL